MRTRMSRLLAPVLATCLLGATVAPAAAATTAPTFQDVPTGYWAAPEISALAAAGILNGVGNDRFDPGGTVTRAQFAAMLARLDRAPATTVGPRFADVPANAWYYQDVQAAAGLGWMEGVGAGTFAPNAPVTRAQAALTLTNYLGLDHVVQDASGEHLSYSDAASVPGWAHGAIAVATGLGLLQGDQGRVLPGAPLTRAQAAVLLSRLESVTPAQLQVQGARVATGVDIAVTPATVDAGQTVQLHAYAHDAQGYLVPAAFTWSETGGALTQGVQSAVAQLLVGAAGTIRVTARVAGGTASGVRTITVTVPSTLRALVPPDALAGQAIPVFVEALTASGSPDPGSDGRMVTVTATPASGSPVSASAALRQGSGTVTIPPLPLGRYTVVVSGLGLSPLSTEMQAVSTPLGQLQLAPAGGAAPQVAVDQQLTIDGAVPGGGTAIWPLTVTATGRQAVLAPLDGESTPPDTLTVQTASATLPASGGPVAIVSGYAAGQSTVTVSVPGGALLPATLPVQVTPDGAFGAVQGASVRAGQSVTVSIGVPAPASASVPVYLEPVDPAGHPYPWVAAHVVNGAARATFQPTVAGTWHLRWLRHGFLPVQAGEVVVSPGPATHLVVDPTPTSVLVPGQSIQLRGALADAYGNPVTQPFSVAVSAAGDAQAGTLTFSPRFWPGPATVGGYTAAATGTRVLTFTSPDHPGWSASVTLRTVPNRVDRVAGKGGWFTFPDWKREGNAQIIAQAKALGLTHLYLEVATTSDGFYGGRALDSLLPQAHAAGLTVIAWIYAGLENPAKDTQILNAVAQYTTPGGDRADGVALDLEEVLTPSVVGAYTAQANADEGPNGLVVLVPYPPAYGPQAPWSAVAGNVQVVAPMDYWHIIERDYTYSEVYQWIASSVHAIDAGLGTPMPVDVIAQTFDEFAGGSGQGIFSPTALEVAAAIRAASDAGAVGVSFYRPTTATVAETRVMASRSWPDG